MKKYFILLIMIIFCSCSKYEGSKDSLEYDNIKIGFSGYSKEYETGKIIIPVVDSTVIEKLNILKTTSQPKWLANVKGTDYVIRLLYTDTNTGDQLLIRILKSKNSTPTIEYGPGTIFDNTYKNDEFFTYVSTLIKLEVIKQYKGRLTQEEYDKINPR